MRPCRTVPHAGRVAGGCKKDARPLPGNVAASLKQDGAARVPKPAETRGRAPGPHGPLRSSPVLPCPPEGDWMDDSVGPAMRRFYLDSKRVSNARAKAELDWRPAYPSWREGLQAVLEQTA